MDQFVLTEAPTLQTESIHSLVAVLAMNQIVSTGCFCPPPPESGSAGLGPRGAALQGAPKPWWISDGLILGGNRIPTAVMNLLYIFNCVFLTFVIS